MQTSDETIHRRIVTAWHKAMRVLARYHRWRVVGTENVPREGGAIVTCTHSLASYDLFIMGAASPTVVGRQAYIVGDDLMFKLPGLNRPTLHALGYIPGGREEAVARLRAGTLLGIAPGGMEESVRGFRQRYQFDWSKRRGFVWVAMKAGAPIVPAVCPASNDIFTVYENPLTTWAYRRFKVPVPLFRGLGLTWVPRPVQLLSVVGEPVYPDVAPDRVRDADVDRMHEKVVERTSRLMARARAMQEPTGALDFDGKEIAR